MGIKRLFVLTFSMIILSSAAKEVSQIQEITFQGNEAFSAKKLKSKLNLKPARLFYLKQKWNNKNKRLLKQDLISIGHFYKENGFLEVVILDSITVLEDKLYLTIKIQEGNRFFWGEVHTTGNSILSDEKIRSEISIQRDQPISLSKLRKSITNLIQLYQDAGKPKITIKDSTKISKESETVFDLFLYFDEGETYYFGKSSVIGLENVHRNVILRELKFKTGEQFNLSVINESRGQIYNLGLFSNVQIKYARQDSIDRRINVTIHCKENAMRNVNINTGISQKQGIIEGAEPISTFNLRSGWIHRNIGKSAESVSIVAEIAKEISKNIQFPEIFRTNIHFHSPWLFGYKIPYGIRLFYHRISGSELFKEQYGINLSIIRGKTDRIWWKNHLTWKQIYLRGENILDVDFGHDNERSYTSEYYSDRRNVFLSPSRGNLTNIILKYSGGILGGKHHYLRADISFSKYYSVAFVSRETKIAFRLKPGAIYSFSAHRDAPLYEKFMLGGVNSIRGLLEDELGADGHGNIRLLGNLEWRLPIYKPWLGGIFTDFGNVWDSFQNLDWTKIFVSIGFGIHYNTPLGPFRIDRSIVVLSPHKRTYKWQWHFALQYGF